MPTLLLLKKYGPLILGAVLVAWATWWVTHTIDVRNRERKLERQETRLLAECQGKTDALKAQRAAADQSATKVSNDYETRLADLDSKLRAAKRVRPNSCITLTSGVQHTGNLAGADATAPGSVGIGRGIDHDQYDDYRATAQRTREVGAAVQQQWCDLLRLNNRPLENYPVCQPRK